jgi:hypothetical protein
MIVIGLDSAPRNIGFCIGSDADGARPSWGLWQPPDYGESDELLIRDVRKWAMTTIKSSGAEILFFEQIIIDHRHVNIPVTHKQFAVVAALMCAAADTGIACYEIEISKWRKRFLGKANAPKHAASGRDYLKEAAMRECLNRGWLIDDHNIAEAVGIWEYGMAFASPEFHKRTKADVVRRELAHQREVMQPEGKALPKPRRRK